MDRVLMRKNSLEKNSLQIVLKVVYMLIIFSILIPFPSQQMKKAWFVLVFLIVFQ